MMGGSAGAMIERDGGTRPHTSQLAEERVHSHRSPARQRSEDALQLVGIDELLPDHGQPPVVSMGDGVGERHEPGRRALVVSGVAAFVEKGYEFLPVAASCIR